MMPSMSGRGRRAVAALILVASVLSVIGILVVRGQGLDYAPSSGEPFLPPEYFYSFGGHATQRLERPIGVLVVEDEVLVSDAGLGTVFRFDFEGELLGTFDEDVLVTPLFLAQNPVDGTVYVSDRGLGAIHVFTPNGQHLGEFDPNLPGLRSAAGEKASPWAPVAVAFAPDGSMYVTDTLDEHRLMVFDPEGGFERSVGTRGMATTTGEAPGSFLFPSGVEVVGNEVWVADSDNRRIQVFDLDGGFLRAIGFTGLPRGLDELSSHVQGTGEESSLLRRIVVVDTLANQVTVLGSGGKVLSAFGTPGGSDGSFAFPNDVAIGPYDRIFIADTANARVQVWGWSRLSRLGPLLSSLWPWVLAGASVFLVGNFFLRRKRKFYATRDFVEAMLDAGLVHEMPDARRTWTVSPADHECLRDEGEDDIRLAELLKSTVHSESDARAIMERFWVDHETAASLSIARRSNVVCTENSEIRRLSRLLGLDVVDRIEYLKRFARKGARRAVKRADSGG